MIIEWFGGEPMLEYDTIPYVRLMTTTGSLLYLERLNKLLNYRVYTYQVTLDGMNYTHDKMRLNKNSKISSFDNVE